MAVQHFSRSAHPHLPPFVRFAIIAAAGIAAAGSINVQARDLTAAVNSNFSTLDTWDAIDNLSRAVSSLHLRRALPVRHQPHASAAARRVLYRVRRRLGLHLQAPSERQSIRTARTSPPKRSR